MDPSQQNKTNARMAETTVPITPSQVSSRNNARAEASVATRVQRGNARVEASVAEVAMCRNCNKRMGRNAVVICCVDCNYYFHEGRLARPIHGVPLCKLCSEARSHDKQQA